MVSSISGSSYSSDSYLASLCSKSKDAEPQAPSSQSSQVENSTTSANSETTASSAASAVDSDTVTISDSAQQMLQEAQAESSPAKIVPADGASPHFVQAVELSDGSQVLQLGDVDASEEYFHKQGQNDLGFLGTCGLVSCGDIANQFGEQVSENDVVHYAVDKGLCTVISDNPAASGGTSMSEQAAILDGLGMPSHVELGDSLEGLGRQLEEGHGVIMEVNAGELWGRSAYYDNGGVNHAVTLTGVAVDQNSGKAVGIWINDSGSGNYQRYISADDPVIDNWKENGEPTVVTDVEHS